MRLERIQKICFKPMLLKNKFTWNLKKSIYSQIINIENLCTHGPIKLRTILSNYGTLIR